MSKIEDLQRIQQLKEKGILTDEEFQKEKEKILSNTPTDNINKETNYKKKKWTASKIVLVTILSFITVRYSVNNYWCCNYSKYNRREYFRK